MGAKESVLNYFSKDYLPFFEKYLKDLHRQANGQYQARCPFGLHEDKEPSLSVNPARGVFKCFACGSQGDIFSFAAKLRGLNPRADFPEVLRGIVDDFNIPTNSSGPHMKAKADFWPDWEQHITACYDYTDEAGALLFQVCRVKPFPRGKEDKPFRQRRPNGRGGYIKGIADTRRVLYRLPEVVKAEKVLFTEGEKDADNLRALGFCATTSPMGASNFKTHAETYAAALAGKSVFIFPDNDEAGRAFAADVARALSGKAAAVRLVALAGLPEKGDVSNYIESFNGDAEAAAQSIRFFMEKAKDYCPPEEEKPKEKQKVRAREPEKEEKEKHADALIRIGKAAELFQTPEGTQWARFQAGEHFECWPIRAKGTGFRRWLVSEYFKESGSAPSATAVQAAVEVLEAEAQFGEKRSAHEVFTRVAPYDGRIFLDLADDQWRAVEISAEGWGIVKAPRFASGALAGCCRFPNRNAAAICASSGSS